MAFLKGPGALAKKKKKTHDFLFKNSYGGETVSFMFLFVKWVYGKK